MRLRPLLIVLAGALVLVAGAGLIRAEAKSVTVKGWVIDSACTFTKSLQKPISPDCAVACAKAGSPLVIQTDGGMIYWPISDAMPATSQNEKLLPFAGKRVTASGKLYERGGSKALVIEKVAAEK